MPGTPTQVLTGVNVVNVVGQKATGDGGADHADLF
jgi:hypothetical protein